MRRSCRRGGGGTAGGGCVCLQVRGGCKTFRGAGFSHSSCGMGCLWPPHPPLVREGGGWGVASGLWAILCAFSFTQKKKYRRKGCDIAVKSRRNPLSLSSFHLWPRRLFFCARGVLSPNFSDLASSCPILGLFSDAKKHLSCPILPRAHPNVIEIVASVNDAGHTSNQEDG